MGKDRASDHKTIRAHKNLVRNLLNSVPDYIQKVQCDTNANTPPFRCAVVTCTNFFDNYKLHQKAPYKFHNFPFHNLVLANKWLEICGLSSDSITGSLTELKVCSDHFELDDYVRNYRQEIFNPNFKRRLFDEAIPHVKVPKPHETSSSAANIISWTVASRSVRLPKNVHQVHSQDRKPNRTKKLKNSDTPELTKIIKQKEALEKDIATLTTSLTRSKKEVSNKRQQLRKAKEQVRKDTVFKLVEKGVFTKAQVKFLLGRKKVIWSDDDYAAAFTLRHVAGKEAYLYMKNELGWPLPSLSSVQIWAASD